jgi:RecB family exonuclease
MSPRRSPVELSPMQKRLPKKLSPSRAKDFMTCPKQFYFKTILGLPQQPSRPAAVGTTAHTAFERIFDLPRDERVVEAAVAFVRPAWEAMLHPLVERESVEPGSPEDMVRQGGEAYRDLVEPGSRAEQRALDSAAGYATLIADEAEYEAFVADCEQMVRNWFSIENPQRFDPDGRELYLSADVGGVEMHGYIDRLDEAGGLWYISDYKGLALDTKLATPAGWTTMGEVAVGDKLLGSDGRPCVVSIKSDVHHRPCYEVVFDDGERVVCDNVHLWSVVRDNGETEVVSADRLIELVSGGERISIPNGAAVVGQDDEVPVEADLLAVELAGRAAKGEVPGPWWNEALTSLQRGPVAGRLTFLNSLVRVCGVWHNGRGQVVAEGDWLAAAVHEVAVGLGAVATRDVIELPGDGGEAVDFHSVRFARMASDLGCAGWDSSAAESREQVTLEALAGGRRVVLMVRKVDSVPTACVQVDSADSLYLAGEGMVPTHNTGKIPNERYLADNFFAMRVYAVMLAKTRQVMPSQLRLVYVKVPGLESIKRMDIDQRVLDTTEKQLKALGQAINTAARSGEFVAKKGPLCNWCDFKDVCPAFHPELEGMLPEEKALAEEL